MGETSNSLKEITERGQVLALALDDVLLELVARSHSISLQGQVVVRNLLVAALDGLEEVVGGVLNTLRNLDEHGTLLTGEVATGTVGHTASLSLTNLDGTGDGLLHVLAHGLGLRTDELTVQLAGSLVGADDTSEHLKASLDLAGIGGDDIAESVQASIQAVLRLSDGSSSTLAVD